MNENALHLYRHIRGKYTADSLLPLKEALSLLAPEQVTHIQTHLSEMGQEMDHFYYNPEGRTQFFYYHFPYYYGFNGLDGRMGDMFAYEKEGFKQTRMAIDKALDEQAYDMYLYYVEGPCDLLLFQTLFQQLEGQNKYDLLAELYQSSDFGHAQLTRAMWEEALAERDHPYTETIPAEGDVLTVYRGHASDSTPVADAMSWTLRPQVAISFMGRSNGKGAVLYTGTIPRSAVLDYFDGRNEAEIICFPEDVSNIQAVTQENPEKVFADLKAKRLADEYTYYKNTVLEKMAFTQTDVHGALHTERVLLLVLALSEAVTEGGLSDRDRAILANVALYHDSARETDGEDLTHGLHAVKQMQKEVRMLLAITCKGETEPYVLSALTEDERALCEWVIRWHCVADEEAFQHLKETPDAPRAKRLFQLFKDADALDRVRIKDLDHRYLRTEVAPHLIGFADYLLAAIR